LRIERRTTTTPARRKPVVAGTRNRPTTPDANDPTAVESEAVESEAVEPSTTDVPAEVAVPDVATPDLGIDEPEDVPSDAADSVDTTDSADDDSVDVADSVDVDDSVDDADSVEVADSITAVESVDEPDSADEPEPAGDDADAAQAPKRSALRTTVALFAAAVVLAVAGTWLTIDASEAKSTANTAVADSGTTADVIGQVDTALETIFSYRYDDTAKTEQAAESLLMGEAKSQYAKLFDQVKQNAPAQKLILTSRVAMAGVTFLVGDDAKLLVFVDQSATRGDTSTDSSGAAQLSVSAHRSDGRWKITDLRTL
jgi:Mce-associated membrane protein